MQERIVFKKLYNFLLDNNLLYKYQSGFLPHHSTVFQLIDIFHNLCQAFDNNMFSCIVFCDVSKAFDRVWHTGLLLKLRQKAFRMVKQLFMSEKAESWFEIMFFWLKIYICRGASGISSRASFILGVYK